MQIPERIKTGWSNYQAAPPLRRYLLIAVLIFAVAYLLWCKIGPQPLKPGATIAGVTSAKVAGMERKAITPKRIMVFTPKAEAVKKLNLPPEQANNDKEEIFEATDAPATRYGSTTTTFVNISTGLPRSVIQAKKAPWFSFEKGNAIGLEAGAGTKGQYYRADYKRDLFQIKGVYGIARVEATQRPTESEAAAAIRLEYRW